MGCIKFKLSILRARKALKVVKMDGKVIELRSPVVVKEFLVNFEGFGVKSSRKSSKPLPLTFELQLGKTYYLFPCKSSAVKRIKVVITKKQLEELLSKKTSMEKIIFGMDKVCTTELSTNWKTNLVPIPEENELI